MFHRKALLTALLAVVLLGSFMDGSVSVDGRHRRKPRLKVADSISIVDPTMRQASLTNLMNRAAVGISAVDPNNDQAIRPDKSRRRRHTAAIEPWGLNQVAGGILGIDPTMRG